MTFGFWAGSDPFCPSRSIRRRPSSSSMTCSFVDKQRTARGGAEPVAERSVGFLWDPRSGGARPSAAFLARHGLGLDPTRLHGLKEHPAVGRRRSHGQVGVSRPQAHGWGVAAVIRAELVA